MLGVRFGSTVEGIVQACLAVEPPHLMLRVTTNKVYLKSLAIAEWSLDAFMVHDRWGSVM